MTPEEREFVESIKLRIVDELADDESGNSERGWMLVSMSKLVRIGERLGAENLDMIRAFQEILKVADTRFMPYPETVRRIEVICREAIAPTKTKGETK